MLKTLRACKQTLVQYLFISLNHSLCDLIIALRHIMFLVWFWLMVQTVCVCVVFCNQDSSLFSLATRLIQAYACKRSQIAWSHHGVIFLYASDSQGWGRLTLDLYMHCVCVCVCVCVRARVFHPLCYKERLLIIILMWNYITAFTSLSVCRMWVIPDVCRTPPHGGSSPSSLEQLSLPLRGLEWWDDDDSALIYVILIWHCLV